MTRTRVEVLPEVIPKPIRCAAATGVPVRVVTSFGADPPAIAYWVSWVAPAVRGLCHWRMCRSPRWWRVGDNVDGSVPHPELMYRRHADESGGHELVSRGALVPEVSLILGYFGLSELVEFPDQLETRFVSGVDVAGEHFDVVQ